MAHYSRDITQTFTTETGQQPLIYLQGNARATVRIEGGSSSDNINLEAALVSTNPPLRDTIATNVLAGVSGNVWIKATSAPLMALGINIVTNASENIKFSIRISEVA